MGVGTCIRTAIEPDVGIDENSRQSKWTTMGRTATKAKDRMDSMEKLRSACSDNLKPAVTIILRFGKHEKMNIIFFFCSLGC